ncbi:class I SAM-dependent methyltransferase [Candidatus Pelagibacter sp.]|nr:class I SAM-dependent methyltransferase [Candidatus Pelagibacter sp.]
MRTFEHVSSHTWKHTIESNKRAIHNKNISLPKHPNAKRIFDIGKSLSGAKAKSLFEIITLKHNPEDFSKLKILSVGPRSEGEVYFIYSLGFKRKNIFAVDLFSYSSLIELGDMHKLNYKNNTFDIILMGWCLAYSTDKKIALSESHRVLKKNGLLVIGHTFAKLSDEEMLSERGFLVVPPNEKVSNEKELEELVFDSGFKKFNSKIISNNKKIIYGATK